MEYLAWVILAVAYIFGAVPIIGGLFTGNDGYKSDFITGAFVHITLSVFGSALFAVLWALYYVTT